MPRRVPLPAHLRAGPFAVKDGEAAGLTAGRLRGADLEAPFSGVRQLARSLHVSGAASDRMVALAQAYLPRLLSGQFFCELTAVALNGLPIPEGRAHENVVHVGVTYPATAPRAKGVVGHQYREARVVLRQGVPFSDAVSAWLECAPRLTRVELVVIGDGLVRRKDPPSTLDAIRAAAIGYVAKRGAKKLREAAESVRPRTDSPRETLIRLIVVDAGLPEPEVNYQLVNRFGAKIALLDLAYPGYRIAIEYDGEHHFTEVRQFHKDIDRLDGVMEEGWRVLRANKSHLERGASSLIARVETALRDRGWRP
jgi:very-short-patch-repair endonuclease